MDHNSLYTEIPQHHLGKDQLFILLQAKDQGLFLRISGLKDVLYLRMPKLIWRSFLLIAPLFFKAYPLSEVFLPVTGIIFSLIFANLSDTGKSCFLKV